LDLLSYFICVVLRPTMSYQRLPEPAHQDGNRYYQAPPPQQQVPQQQHEQQYYQPHPSPYIQQQQQPPQQQYQQYPYPPQQAQQYAPAPIAQPYGSAPLIQAAHPGVAGHVIRGIWTDGPFDCFDSGVICLLALFAPCIRWGMTISRAKYLTLPVAILLFAAPYLTVQGCYMYLSIQYPETYGTQATTQYDSLYIALMSLMGVCQVLTVLIGAYYRNKIRTDYLIPGNVVEDCLWHTCCQCCAIAQEARHVDRDYGIPV
jgi:Cys-rich protein (TIGR01571 family)